MTSKKVVSISIDADLKDQADRLFEELGISMSSAVSLFLHSAVSTGSIPFEIRKSDEEADAENAEADQVTTGTANTTSGETAGATTATNANCDCEHEHHPLPPRRPLPPKRRGA